MINFPIMTRLDIDSHNVENTTDTQSGVDSLEPMDSDHSMTTIPHLPDGWSKDQIEDALPSIASALDILGAPLSYEEMMLNADSASTIYDTPKFSLSSAGSSSLTTASTLLEPSTPDSATFSEKQHKDFSFDQYDLYLSVIDPRQNHPKTIKESRSLDNINQAVSGAKTKRSKFNVESGFKLRWRKKTPQPTEEDTFTCASCRADFETSNPLQSIHCRHTYCGKCLKSLIRKIMTYKSGLHSGRCPQPLPASQFNTTSDADEEQTRTTEYLTEKATQEVVTVGVSTDRVEAGDEDNFFNHTEMLQQYKEYHNARYIEQKQNMIKRHAEQEKKMKDDHAEALECLEDKQVAAELDLRNILETRVRSTETRLKHMETYCYGLGINNEGENTESWSQYQRVVTDTDLRELGRQWNIWEGMDRAHQTKIHILRYRQERHMDELVRRQNEEYENLVEQNRAELDELVVNTEDILSYLKGDI